MNGCMRFPTSVSDRKATMQITTHCWFEEFATSARAWSCPSIYSGAMNNAEEQHYTPEQLAKLWGLSASTIRRLFEHSPGVLVITYAEMPHSN